jgi:arginine:pyruvate transaminase
MISIFSVLGVRLAIVNIGTIFMRYAPLVERISGQGSNAWKLHAKALKARTAGEDVIVMSVGDPDFSSPPKVIDTAINALKSGDTHYTDVAGRPALREAIARDHQARSGQTTGPGNVVALAGAQCALFAAMQCMAGPGDDIIVLEPAYVTYEATVQAPGPEFISVAQSADTGFRPDPDLIRAAVTENTRAIMFATPSNPTGVALNRSELEAIAKIAIENDLWVLSDEVYGALTFEAPHVSIAGLPGMAERCVTVCSLSKSHAMTGWRVGWVVAPEEMAGHVAKLALCMLYGLPGFIQQAAIEALSNGARAVQEGREIYKRRLDLALSALSAVKGLSCLTPEAGMFLMVDVRSTGLTSAEFANQLYQSTGVSLLDATAFGASAEGHVRLSFAVSDEQIIEGCRRIARFVDTL